MSSHWTALMTSLERFGDLRAHPAQFDHDANRDGALFVGDAEEIAERIVALHKRLGHMRSSSRWMSDIFPRRCSCTRSNCWHKGEAAGRRGTSGADFYQEAVDVR